MDEKILREQLVALLKGGQAFVTFEDALKNVNADNRNKKPADNIHSIWEELEHMRIAQEDILKYIVDPDWISPSWPDGYWPKKKSVTVDDKKWDKSITDFLNGREELLKIIQDEKINLTSVIPHTKKHTYLREILLVADHNAYHLGQILTARKLLNDWKS